MAANGMIKSIFASLFSLLIFIGCKNDDNKIQIDLNNSKNFVVGDFNVFIQSLSITELEKALQFSKSRFQYYQSHFVDSYDPYSGIASLPQWCLDKIYFNEDPVMDNEGFWNYALFPQDDQRNPGCLDISNKSLLIIRYCEAEEKVISVWLSNLGKQDITLKPVGFSCTGSLRYH